MSIFSTLLVHTDTVIHHFGALESLVSQTTMYSDMSTSITHGSSIFAQADTLISNSNIILAQADTGIASDASGLSKEQYKELLSNVTQEEQLGWLANIGKHFIGMFQKGGETFAGFVSGIIPTLVVLMTAFYALTELIGEQRVHGIARGAGRIALTRYTVLPIIAMFFLTNPMAYTFGSFLEEKHKPAFYDATVSYCHAPLGLFPHINPGEYFVWGGVLVALLELEKKGVVQVGFHIQVAIWYAIVGLIVILLKGMLTEKLTQILARRQNIEL